MLQTLYDLLKRQRLAWSWALIVGLFLVWWGHAPVLPVVLGCLFAVAIAMFRSWTGARGKVVSRGAR
jgi:predicted PurR-regulated permease PerM